MELEHGHRVITSGVTKATTVCVQGARLFRMQRDDTYIQAMLAVVSRFYCLHVLSMKAPPQNMFSERRDYRLLLQRTLELAKGALPVVDLPEQQLVPSINQHMFVADPMVTK